MCSVLKAAYFTFVLQLARQSHYGGMNIRYQSERSNVFIDSLLISSCLLKCGECLLGLFTVFRRPTFISFTICTVHTKSKFVKASKANAVITCTGGVVSKVKKSLDGSRQVERQISRPKLKTYHYKTLFSQKQATIVVL